MNQDQLFMKEAIRLSGLAVEHGNEPFGAVLVKDGAIVYSNENQIYTHSDPCFMCCGAMVWTKLGRLVYGASDMDLCEILQEKGAECCRIVFENSGWKPQVTAGVLREESLAILMHYFQKHAKG